MKKAIIILLLLIQGNASFAQDYLSDFAKMRNVYLMDRTLSVNVTYFYYHSHSDKKSVDTLSGNILMHKYDFDYKLGNYEMFKNRNYCINVDYPNKTIIVEKASLIPFQQTSFALFDSLLTKKGISVNLLSKGQGVITYQLLIPDGAIQEYDVTLYTDSYLINKMLILYREKIPTDNSEFDQPKLNVVFSNYKAQIYDPGRFSEARYIVVNQSVLKAQPAYSDFKLINSLSQ